MFVQITQVTQVQSFPQGKTFYQCWVLVFLENTNYHISHLNTNHIHHGLFSNVMFGKVNVKKKYISKSFEHVSVSTQHVKLCCMSILKLTNMTPEDLGFSYRNN